MDWLFPYTDPSIDWGDGMTMLAVRFLGVVVVLGSVAFAIRFVSRLIRSAEARSAQRAADDPAEPAPADLSVLVEAATMAADLSVFSVTTDAGIGIDDATAAAIGLALALEAGEHVATSPPVVSASGSSSAWAMAGRLRNLR